MVIFKFQTEHTETATVELKRSGPCPTLKFNVKRIILIKSLNKYKKVKKRFPINMIGKSNSLKFVNLITQN